jgi:hypothetical protein
MEPPMAKASKKLPSFMMAKFEKKDRAADKKAGVKEGSKKDMALDAKAMKYRKGGMVRGKC